VEAAIMRRASWAWGLVFLLLAATPGRAADAPVKGLFLTTDYPAITARAGDVTTVKLTIHNYDLPPERVALAIAGVPEGWRATLLGGGAPIGAAMPASNQSVALQLRLDIPAHAASGTSTLTIHAKGADSSLDLPIAVTIGQDLPTQLGLKTKLPSLRGTPKSSFDYQFTVKNESDKDLLVQLAADAPRGFQPTFTEAYGTQEISSIPIEAGQSKDLKVKIQPPDGVAAGSYPALLRVSADGAKAEAKLTMQITGQPSLRLSTRDGRLSGDAVAGKATPISLVVTNDGTAAVDDVELSSSPPSDWKVSFAPQKIEELAPGQKRTVQALLTPSAKALAGDYMMPLQASGKGGSSSANYRVTVSTSTLWGAVGIAIIAAALLVAVGAVARFGRR